MTPLRARLYQGGHSCCRQLAVHGPRPKAAVAICVGLPEELAALLTAKLYQVTTCSDILKSMQIMLLTTNLTTYPFTTAAASLTILKFALMDKLRYSGKYPIIRPLKMFLSNLGLNISMKDILRISWSCSGIRN